MSDNLKFASYSVLHLMSVSDDRSSRIQLSFQEDDDGQLVATFIVNGKVHENPIVLDKNTAWQMGDALKRWAAGIQPPPSLSRIATKVADTERVVARVPMDEGETA
jgi:hypothetical protein